MSVPVGKRGVSKMEFFHLAHKLNREMTMLLIRDFGIKSISRDLKSFCHSAKMNEEDRTAYIGLCQKYHIDVEADWPLWLIEHYRNWILQILRSLIDNITSASTIYPAPPDFDYWHNLRKKYQKEAQADCNKLLKAVQLISEIAPVKKEKLLPYIELIEKEIGAIKAWQKNTNRQRANYIKSLEQ